MLVSFLRACLFFALSVVSDISSPYLHGIPQNQYNALEDFYNTTNGPNWKWDIVRIKLNFTVWNFSTRANPCSDNWQGLYCDCFSKNRCTIAKISLPGYNLSGSIPNSFDSFTDLIQLTLENNHITGPLPDSFQNLRNLSILEMKLNLFQKFPETVSLCKSLTLIDFSYNLLSKTLPSSISQLSSLTRIYLNNNYLNGTLPLGLWNLTEIMELHIFHNFFTGTISNQISQLKHLRRFVIHSNSFFGSIPDSFPVTSLDLLSLGDNHFSNTIPANFQNARLLKYLYLFSNAFSGTFNLGNNIPSLVNLQIYDNFFRGNLTYLQDYHEMAFLLVSDNMFTNFLPFANWTDLLVYEASNNFFTGTFPNSYSNLCFLEEFKIGSNFLTGRLSPSATLFGIILTTFNVSYNLFTGTIPVVGCSSNRVLTKYDPGSYCWNLTIVETIRKKRPQLVNTTFSQVDAEFQTLTVNNNFFTGSLPEFTCFFTQLSVISFSNNEFTGAVPLNYTLLQFANQFTIGNNKLNGPIGPILSVFNSFKRLNVLDLSENQFTGTIPDGTTTKFYEANAKTLKVLNFGINCLSGTLPEALCQLHNLRTLILDGLTSSPRCTLSLFPGLNTFVHKYKFSGTIPSCLFEISGLQTLHSSGNGITGNLPQALNLSDSIDNLCLSHNELTGSIPLSIQQKLSWETLDLSYNRLSGTLSPSFYPFPNSNDNSSEETLSLQINHLSGNIPSSLLATSSSSAMSSLSILQGNIFNCGNDKSEYLPSNDEHYQDYDCASDTAVLLIILSSLLTGLCLIAIFVILLPWKNTITLKLRKFTQEIINWKETFNYTNASIDTTSSFYLLKSYLSSMIKLILIMITFAIIIVQPIWIGMSGIYGTYQFEYVWSVSAVFMSGQTPSIILLLIFVVWFSLFFYTIETKFIIPESSSQIDTDNNHSYQLINPNLIYYVYILVILTDACIMLGVDIIFVVCTLNLRSNVLIVILTIIAFLRVLINNVLVWEFVPIFCTVVERIYLQATKRTTLIMMRKTGTEHEHEEQMKEDSNIKISSEGKVERRKHQKEKEEKEMHLFQFVNEEFLIGKILVLNNIFYPVLAVIIILPDCFYYAFVQASTVTSSFSYLACSIYSFNVCIPASIEVVTATTSFIPPFGYSYLCAANLITYYISLFFLSFFFSAIGIPLLKLFLKFSYERIILEFDETEGIPGREIKTIMKERTTFQKMVLLLVPNRFRCYRSQIENTQIIDFGFCGRNYTFNLQGIPLSNWKKFICQINGDLTILFSFGVLFPPLMIFGGICLIGIISFEFLTIGKLLYETRQLNYLWYEKELLNESQRLMNVFRSNMYWTMFISCLLLGFIVFDTWGVEKGWYYGLIGFLILNIIPLCTFYLYYWFRKTSPEPKRNRSTITEGIEVSVLKEIRAGKRQEETVTHVDNPIICHNI
jgi:hypothetical protein